MNFAFEGNLACEPYWEHGVSKQNPVATGTIANTDFCKIVHEPVTGVQNNFSSPGVTIEPWPQFVQTAFTTAFPDAAPTGNVFLTSDHIYPSASSRVSLEQWKQLLLSGFVSQRRLTTKPAAYSEIFQATHFSDAPIATYLLLGNEQPTAVWSKLGFESSELPSFAGGKHKSELLLDIGRIPIIGKKVANRIHELEAQWREEESGSGGISFASLEAFVEAFGSVENLIQPNLSITPDGNIYASWRAIDKTFSVHFLSPARVKYVILRPDPQNSERMLSSTGTSPASLVFRIPETGAATWISV